MDRHSEGPIQRHEGPLVFAFYVDGSEPKPKEQRQDRYLRLERGSRRRLAAQALWIGHLGFRDVVPYARCWPGMG